MLRRGIAAPYMVTMPPVVSPVDETDVPATSDQHASAYMAQRHLLLLADVTEQLLTAADPAALVDRLFEVIRDELKLDVFFHYRLDGDRLRLEAHGGLTEAEARDGAELALGQAVCGCVARDGRPIHATAVQASTDPLHAFVRKLGLDAYACTPLTHGDRIMGTLGFGRRWASRFSDDELRFLHTICHYVALAQYRLRVEAALRDGVEARERLLAELNHRVRNALQVAVGLVAVELGHADTAASEPLRRAVARLQVLALAHRPLYAGATPDAIDVARLLTGIVEDGSAAVVVEQAQDLGGVPVETAVALALLVHTLLAGRADDASITIEAGVGGDGLRLLFRGLSVSDGVTLPPADSRMQNALLRQLRAWIESDAAGLCLHLPLRQQ